MEQSRRRARRARRVYRRRTRAINPSRRSVCKSLIAAGGLLGIIRWVGSSG
jgi:hypothetical protein